MSEKSIINTLLVVCLALGFLCVATIYLPSKLGNAGAPPPGFRNFSPANLLALLPQKKNEGTKSEPPIELTDGTLVRFTPQEGPAIPALVAQAAPDTIQAQGLASAKPLPEPSSLYTRSHRQSSLAANAPANIKDPKKKAWYAVPLELETDVDFWRAIYAKYDSHHVVLHDMKYLSVVYGVMNFADLDADTSKTDFDRQREKQARIDAEKESIIAILCQLEQGVPAEQLSDRAMEIKKMWRVTDEPGKFKKARERGVRAQTGQKDKFITGLQYSGRYHGEIESIFENQGLPKELTFLIFVESMFNPAANSSAGARGLWQFMRGTGKIYGLRVNSLIDERADPIRATYAAANLLKHDYEILGSWPLAINAYNTGRGRIEQGMARLGTSNIASIIKYFDHPHYGFASRNFYLEYLAAMDVAKNHQHYFGNVHFDQPMRYDLIRVGNPVSLPDIAQSSNVPIAQLAEMNPQYSASIFSGEKPLPAGSELRVPEKKGEIFLAYCERAPQTFPLWHIVGEGETVQDIAAMYNVPVSNILRMNKIMGRRLQPGQELRITR